MINFFKRKKKAKKDIFETGEFNIIHPSNLQDGREFLTTLVYSNHMVDTVYPACAACYGISEKKNTEYQERVEYIGRRVKTRHTSILEHSNTVIQIFIPVGNDEYNINDVYEYNPHIKPELSTFGHSTYESMSMILEVTDLCRYLKVHSDTVVIKGTPYIRMTFGGSIRGYRYIFENIKNRYNPIFTSIFDVLKLVVEPEFFIDFINDNAMDSYTTIDVFDKLKENIPGKVINTKDDDFIDIINMDNLDDICRLTKLEKEDCLDFVSMTVDFKRMSRIITQQVTRHRNGITQESQRYVNYSDSMFNSPTKFKEKYDIDKIYDTPIGDYTLDDLGNLLTSIYRYLVDQGVEKEDARGYLPANTQCGKLFMTFTLRTLFAFIHLRTDSHAQVEIQKYAHLLTELTKEYAKSLGNEDMIAISNYYVEPIYKRINEEIDEIL